MPKDKKKRERKEINPANRGEDIPEVQLSLSSIGLKRATPSDDPYSQS